MPFKQLWVSDSVMSPYQPKPSLHVLILQFFFFSSSFLLITYSYLPYKQNQATLKSELKCKKNCEDSTKDQGTNRTEMALAQNMTVKFQDQV